MDLLNGMLQKDQDEFRRICNKLINVCFICRQNQATRSDFYFIQKYKEKFDSQIVFVSSKSSLIFKTQGLKALCFIRKSHLDNDFKVFKQLYDEESKNELEIGRKYKKEVNEAFRNYLMDKF